MCIPSTTRCTSLSSLLFILIFIKSHIMFLHIQFVLHILLFYCFALFFILLHILLLISFFFTYIYIYIYIYSCVVLLLYNLILTLFFYSLHCPLSGPDLTYISLLIIPCIIYHVTNKETLNLEPLICVLVAADVGLAGLSPCRTSFFLNKCNTVDTVPLSSICEFIKFTLNISARSWCTK